MITHPKMTTATANYHILSRSLWDNLVKDTSINYSTPPKSHVHPVIYINNDGILDILVAVVFAMITQLGGISTKEQDLVTSFQLIKYE